ncbi:hypothetical protein N3K66_003106 [Trichothecium roseum]|uniref:Uncharacterized protein n=1 Tax=Trichothecium roseum TaxID=47278 RepID=A0ACC0V618_9HYPO|nr:hypothetical protein N3K66_003106 [Trichothecium roseum]
MDDETGQRRIELQTNEDLTYLIGNVRRAAAARLNEAFPVVEGEDELREHIESLVDEYINKTFTLASPNLSINGMPVKAAPFLRDPSTSAAAPEVAYEPFDYRKRKRVADLVEQEERLLEEVANLKRGVPAKAAADYDQSVRAGLERDGELARKRIEGVRAPGLEGVGVLERQEGVEGGWKGAVEGLGRLKKDMPAIVARMERARVAGEYVVSDGQS